MKKQALQPPAPDKVVIERIETVLVDLPTIRPHQLAMATMRGQTLMLLSIHCLDGGGGDG